MRNIFDIRMDDQLALYGDWNGRKMHNQGLKESVYEGMEKPLRYFVVKMNIKRWISSVIKIKNKQNKIESSLLVAS